MKNRAPSSHDYAEPRNRVSFLANLRPVEPERSFDSQMDEQDGHSQHDITLTTDSSTKFQGMLNKLKALLRKNDIVKSASLPRPKNGPKNKISFDALEKNNLEEFPNVVTYQTKAQELDFVDSLNNIPSYHALISLKGGTLEVAESISPQVAVLALTDQEPRSDVKVPLAIILTAEFIETHAYHTLRERARTKNYLIKTTILGTTGVIDRLYARHRTTEIAAQTQTLDESSAEHGRAVSMIRMAVDRGASDIHIELRGDTAIVRMRIDSVLVKVDELTSAVMNNVMGHIYTKMAVVNSRSDPVYNELNMQSCMIQYKTDLYSIKLRYASSPVLGGTDFVLRVLKDSAQTITEIPRLPDLGYSELQSRQLKMASHKIFGAILLSGGTGSGKSTTIRTLIAWHPQLLYTKTISVEDPVEYQIPHTSQMSVQRSISHQGGGKIPSSLINARSFVLIRTVFSSVRSAIANLVHSQSPWFLPATRSSQLFMQTAPLKFLSAFLFLTSALTESLSQARHLSTHPFIKCFSQSYAAIARSHWTMFHPEPYSAKSCVIDLALILQPCSPKTPLVAHTANQPA